MRAEPITPIIGAEILDLDLARALTPVIEASLRSLLLAHGVLVFRDQIEMSRDQHIALARVFGPLERSPIGQPGYPEIARITHDAKRPPTENIWHVDHSFRSAPPRGAVLRTIDVPAVGGDTLFADLRAVFRRIPMRLAGLLRTLAATHDIAKWAPRDRVGELHEAARVQTHPVIRLHPETGEEILFVNAAYTTSIVGLGEDDSVDVLNFLLREVNVPEVQCRVRWQPGTVVVWDNCALQHYAVADYHPHCRIMERVSIAGEPVVGPRTSGRQSPRPRSINCELIGQPSRCT